MPRKIDTFQSRLRAGLDQRTMTQSELAKLSGVSKSSISRYLSGAWEAKQDAVYMLAHALNVSEAWLMGYDVPMERNSSTASASAIPPGFDPLPQLENVPRVGRIACGDPILAEENIETYDSVPSSWNATFTLLCVGDSMSPRILDGDMVAIHKQPCVENGQIAAVRIENEATLKRVYLYPDRMVLQPENQAYAPIVLVGEEMNTVSIEGKAVGLCRAIV